jgi:hypothetical protein
MTNSIKFIDEIVVTDTMSPVTDTMRKYPNEHLLLYMMRYGGTSDYIRVMNKLKDEGITLTDDND